MTKRTPIIDWGSHTFSRNTICVWATPFYAPHVSNVLGFPYIGNIIKLNQLLDANKVLLTFYYQEKDLGFMGILTDYHELLYLRSKDGKWISDELNPNGELFYPYEDKIFYLKEGSEGMKIPYLNQAIALMVNSHPKVLE